MDEFRSSFSNVISIINHPRPPWTLRRPGFIWDLLKFKKASTSSVVFGELFLDIVGGFRDPLLVFTDGSRCDEGVGCAFVMGDMKRSFRLNSDASVFTAEIKAIELALVAIEKQAKDIVVIVSDSLSSLRSISDMYATHPIVQSVQVRLHALAEVGKRVFLMWVPSHSGIKGNETVDSLARSGARRLCVDFDQMTFEDLKSSMRRSILQRWVGEWSALTNNKLRLIKPSIFPLTGLDLDRRDQVRITRLRIGHTYFSHGNLLRGEFSPWCLICNTRIDVVHILVECPMYTAQRCACRLGNRTLGELLCDPDLFRGVILFLRRIGLYNKV